MAKLVFVGDDDVRLDAGAEGREPGPPHLDAANTPADSRQSGVRNRFEITDILSTPPPPTRSYTTQDKEKYTIKDT